ncbi:unnamed protein product, partial [Chrysoparadoxa australica]
MPITPRFHLDQDDEFVSLAIRVPYVRVGAAESHVSGCELMFYCKPYLLKLTLPHEVVGDEDERFKARYDPNDEGGTLVLQIPKLEKGQHFPDLDLTTKLLQPRWAPKEDLASGASIEVLQSETFKH